jgi:hypothetical protein
MTAFDPALIVGSIINPDQIRFKFSDVAWVGSITRDFRACYAWATTGIKTWDDLKKYKHFNIGAQAPGTSSYVNAAMLKNIFGIMVRHVTGYTSSAEQRLAIERGELDGGCGTWSSMPPDWINSKKVNPVIKFSPVVLPGLSEEVPLARDLTPNHRARDVLDLLTAPDAFGRPYVVSKWVPTDRVVMLRTAFDATMKDAQFLAEAENLGLPVSDPIPGSEAEKIIGSIYAAPSDLVAHAQAVIGK